MEREVLDNRLDIPINKLEVSKYASNLVNLLDGCIDVRFRDIIYHTIILVGNEDNLVKLYPPYKDAEKNITITDVKVPIATTYVYRGKDIRFIA